MAGFFDRLKERFTQNAAGTADISQLSEEQQKLLRRQYIGRLGSSLAQTGDFGAGMAEQAKFAEQQRAQMQAEAMQRQRQSVFGNIMGGGEQASPQSPLTPEQQALVATPRPLASPETRSQQAGIAAQQAQAPQPAAAQGGIPADLRDRLKRGVLELQALGDTDGAKQLLEYAKQFAPLETWFAPTEYFDPETKQTRLSQFSNLGSRQLTDTQAAPTDKVQSLIAMQQDPTLFQMEGALRAQGAPRNTFHAPNLAAAEMVKLDSKRLDAIRTEANQAVASLPSVRSAYDALKGQNTGALQNAMVPLIRMVNPGADIAQAQTIAAAGMTPQLLVQLAGIGGSDTVREVELMLANLPSTANPWETNAMLFEVILQGAERKVADAQAAEQLFYDQGGSLRGFQPQGNIMLDAFRQQFEQDRAPSQPGSVAARYGLE